MLDDFYEYVSSNLPNPNIGGNPVPPNIPNVHKNKPKLWSMKKEDIIKYWSYLQPNLPLSPKIIDDQKKGSTFSEDGIRITGSKKYIDSVLSRIKDILRFETPQTKLELVYRQQESKSKTLNVSMVPSFVFYAHVRERENKG